MSDADYPGYSGYMPGYSGFGGPEYQELYPESPGMNDLKRKLQEFVYEK